MNNAYDDATRSIRVTGAGGGQQYAEDAAHGSGDLGTMALGVRNDAGTALAGTTGDYIPLTTDSTGALRVTGGSSFVDDAAFTVGTTTISPVGGTYKSTRDAIDDNDAGAIAITPKRGQYVTLETPLADSAMDDTYDAVKTIPSSYATDDSVMPATPVTIPVSGEYRLAATTYADGDVTVLQTDSIGDLKITNGTLQAGEDLTNNVQGTLRRPVASATYTPSISMIMGSDVDVSVKGAAGNLLSITVSNINAAIRYLQIHNKATAPANPDVPIISLPIPAGSATVPSYVTLGANELGDGGVWCSTGIAIGVSTTNATFTAATTTDHNQFTTYI